tara:strand:+ start:1021 stop:1254 length:234 start_codon:yes stop_codon:yes gene_type:complete
MFNFYLKLRLKAIRNSAKIINSGPFGPYSLNDIEKARDNRELNLNWFRRDYNNIKKKLSNEDFEELKINLGINSDSF